MSNLELQALVQTFAQSIVLIQSSSAVANLCTACQSKFLCSQSLSDRRNLLEIAQNQVHSGESQDIFAKLIACEREEPTAICDRFELRLSLHPERS
jgi:hypothetical protein